MSKPTPSADAVSGLSLETLALTGAFLRFARWRAVLAVILIVAGSFFDGLGLLLLVPILGLVVGSPASGGSGRLVHWAESLVHGFPASWRLEILLAAFVALMLVRAVFLHLRDRTTEPLQLEFVEEVRQRIVRRLARAGWAAAAGANHARVLQVLSVEIHQLGVATSAGLLAAVAFAMLIGLCILALALAPLAGLSAIAFALVLGLVSRPYLNRSRRLGRTIIEAHLGMAEGATAFLGGFKLALAQGLEGRFVDQYAADAARSIRDRVQFSELQSTLRNLTTGGAALTGVLVFIVGLKVFHLSAPVLVTLLIVLSRMGALAATVQHGLQQVAHSLPGYAAILALEAEFPRPDSNDGSFASHSPPSRTCKDAALTWDAVSYTHDPQAGRRPELDGVSLTIRAGAFVGVAGPSGVGKTTFLDLAAGILTPRSGAIFAFGERLEGEVLTHHRERLAYVSQETYLFDGTVRANLTWAAPHCPEADLLKALEAVGAQPLLTRLGDGLDTRIGHRGALLSAGERQRLALAAALLRRPRLLLLDEATNAIDIEGEKAILQTIVELRRETTTLMVAHRPESLHFCDEILEFPALTSRDKGGGELLEAEPTVGRRPHAG